MATEVNKKAAAKKLRIRFIMDPPLSWLLLDKGIVLPACYDPHLMSDATSDPVSLTIKKLIEYLTACENTKDVLSGGGKRGGPLSSVNRWKHYLVSLFLPSPLVTLPSPFVSLSPLAVSLAAIFFVSPLPFSLASAFFVSPLALSLAATFLSSPLPLASAFFSSAAAFFSSPIFSAATAAEAMNIEAINTLRKRFIKSSLWIVSSFIVQERNLWPYRPPLDTAAVSFLMP